MIWQIIAWLLIVAIIAVLAIVMREEIQDAKAERKA